MFYKVINERGLDGNGKMDIRGYRNTDISKDKPYFYLIFTSGKILYALSAGLLTPDSF
jgi:hypothetical protein